MISFMHISIIIPIYNVEKYVERCVKSVLNQTHNSIEVIFVDDCSQDKSMEIAKNLIEDSNQYDNFSFLFLKHDKNRGLSAARNTGIEAATGYYLYFLDSDDELCADSIKLLVESAERNGLPDVVCGSYQLVNGLNRKDKIKQGIFLSNSHEIVSFYTSGKSYMMAWNKMIKLEFLKRNNLYFKEGIIHEDDLWSYLVVNKAQTFMQVPAISYRYHYNPNSTMTASKEESHNDCRMILLQSFEESYNTGDIINCKENRKFITLQKVYFLEPVLFGTIDCSEKQKYFIQVFKLNHRISFLFHFMRYYTFIIMARIWHKLK